MLDAEDKLFNGNINLDNDGNNDNDTDNNDNNDNNSFSNTKTIKIEMESNKLEDLIFKMFALTGLNISNIEELEDVILDRDDFLHPDLYQKVVTFIPEIKNFLKSSYLTSLHANTEKKQRFPCINLYRQVLRCQQYKMIPVVVSQGYDKSTGKKITKRFFRIEKNSFSSLKKY